jgi:propionyl-CoA carboxylase beta chain
VPVASLGKPVTGTNFGSALQNPRAANFTAHKLVDALPLSLRRADRGYIDDVIMPQATPPRIARTLAILRGKTVEIPGRKHDNLPV